MLVTGKMGERTNGRVTDSRPVSASAFISLKLSPMNGYSLRRYKAKAESAPLFGERAIKLMK